VSNTIWVDIDLSYDYRIIAYRLSDGVAGTLKDAGLRKAEQVMDHCYYDSNNGGATRYYGLNSEIEIDEKGFT
jgi:hypothetical protein